jgi:hypothetical protein
MWVLNNGTPFAVDRTIAVDKSGERSYVVVVKGTFDIAAAGQVVPAQEQLPVEPGPKHRGDPGETSLIYEQELVGPKPRTDLYLNASAYAPQGRRSTQLHVGVRTPAGMKSLLVSGDRSWERSPVGTIKPSAVKPFETMPITYERAHGGYDRDDPDPQNHRLDRNNPVGVGFYTDASHRVGKLLPNIEFLEGGKGVAGYGALCSFWEPRIRYQGTYDARWVESQKPLLPRDYDPQWLQCAPVDQQFAPHLVGGEKIELVNLTPEGVLQFPVPKRYFAFTTRIGRKQLEHRAKLNTVIVEPDHPRVIVLWASALACHHDIDNIDVTDITEKEYV